MVFQHFSLFETLTVVENVALALPGKPALDALAQRIVEVSERYGLPVDPRRHIHALSVASASASRSSAACSRTAPA